MTRLASGVIESLSTWENHLLGESSALAFTYPKMDTLVNEIRCTFSSHADDAHSQNMACYMRGRFVFFGIKTIGWLLREHSKLYPVEIRRFIDSHLSQLDKLSIREGRKYLERVARPA